MVNDVHVDFLEESGHEIEIGCRMSVSSKHLKNKGLLHVIGNYLGALVCKPVHETLLLPTSVGFSHLLG